MGVARGPERDPAGGPLLRILECDGEIPKGEGVLFPSTRFRVPDAFVEGVSGAGPPYGDGGQPKATLTICCISWGTQGWPSNASPCWVASNSSWLRRQKS